MSQMFCLFYILGIAPESRMKSKFARAQYRTYSPSSVQMTDLMRYKLWYYHCKIWALRIGTHV